MLMRSGDCYIAGPLDVICILLLPAGTYHAAVFEERPLPGPIEPTGTLAVVRLKSKMHHTAGASSMEGALAHVADLRQRIHIDDANVVDDRYVATEDPVSVWVLTNWIGREGGLVGAMEAAGLLDDDRVVARSLS